MFLALFPMTHSAQSTPVKNFRVLSGAGFFTMDPRLKKGVVDSEVFQWGGATSKFTCAATTEDGDIAIGTCLCSLNNVSN